MTEQNEQALRQLLDDALEANNMNLASSRMDNLLRHLVKIGHFGEMTPMLEEIVEEHPEEWSFRWRLTSLYERLGQIDDAIQHLEILSEQMHNAEDADGAMMVDDRLIQLRGN